MSARIPPGFAEIWTAFSVGGDPEPMYVSLGVDLAVGVGANLTTANAMQNVMVTNLDNLLSQDYGVSNGHVIFGNDGGDIRIDTTVTPQTGDQTQVALPQNVAMLVRKITATGGRRGRGRMFIPGVPINVINGSGSLTGTYPATAESVFNDIQTTLEGLADVETLVLFHDTAPFTPTPITDLIVQSKLATQRRRLRP